MEEESHIQLKPIVPINPYFKIIEQAIEKINTLKDLFTTTKRRLCEILTVEEFQFNQEIEIKDNVHVDFYYVIQGTIEVHFTRYINLTDKENEVLTIREGQFFDQIKKQRKNFKEYFIAKIVNKSSNTKEYKQGTLLEEEEQYANYIYLVLKGEARIMKRPERIYDQDGRLLKVKNLDCLKDPKQLNEEKVGIDVGEIRGEQFLCEDAIFFEHKLSYSVIAKSDLLVYRIPSKEAFEIIPKECQNEIKLLSLEKYRWFYERLAKIENTLTNNKDNFQEIQTAGQIGKHTTHNYPCGNQQILKFMRQKHMEQAEGNEKIYLTSQNRRMHKFAKPLTGYVQQEDIDKLDKVYDLVFKYEKERLNRSEVTSQNEKIRRGDKYRPSLVHQQTLEHRQNLHGKCKTVNKMFENSILCQNTKFDYNTFDKQSIDSKQPKKCDFEDAYQNRDEKKITSIVNIGQFIGNLNINQSTIPTKIQVSQNNSARRDSLQIQRPNTSQLILAPTIKLSQQLKNQDDSDLNNPEIVEAKSMNLIKNKSQKQNLNPYQNTIQVSNLQIKSPKKVILASNYKNSTISDRLNSALNTGSCWYQCQNSTRPTSQAQTRGRMSSAGRQNNYDTLMRIQQMGQSNQFILSDLPREIITPNQTQQKINLNDSLKFQTLHVRFGNRSIVNHTMNVNSQRMQQTMSITPSLNLSNQKKRIQGSNIPNSFENRKELQTLIKIQQGLNLENSSFTLQEYDQMYQKRQRMQSASLMVKRVKNTVNPRQQAYGNFLNSIGNV